MSLAGNLWASATTAAAPGLRLLLRQRTKRGKEIGRRLNERRGIEGMARPDAPLAWLHAASVGESVSVLPVLVEIARQREDLVILMTTGSVASAELLMRQVTELGLRTRVLHRFIPLDVPRWTKRFVDHWRPDVGALVESELWPNLLAACRARRIPIMLLNARMSEGSFRKWRYVRGFAGEVLSSFNVIQAQSGTDAIRIRSLGGKNVHVPGNLKFAAPPLSADSAELLRLQRVIDGRSRWLAASIHPNEFDIVIRAHRLMLPRCPGLVTIIVPRHPEKTLSFHFPPDVQVTRRSLEQDPLPGGIWLADTMGELGSWYRLSRCALIGKSLVPPGGGQNPLEAARLGCAVAIGPHTGNFADAVQVLSEAGALTSVKDASSIAEWVGGLLNDPERLNRIGVAAEQAAARFTELPKRMAAELLSFIPACG